MGESVFFIFKVPSSFQKEQTKELLKKFKETKNLLKQERIKSESDKIICSFGPGWVSIELGRGKNNNYLRLYATTTSHEENILELSKKIYAQIKCPGIGFTDCSASSMGKDKEDIEIWGGDEFWFSGNYDVLNFDTLFDFNILTKKEVDKIGKKKILSLPREICDCVEELEDGAIFMRITFIEVTANGKMRNAVRKYLGMKIYGKTEDKNNKT